MRRGGIEPGVRGAGRATCGLVLVGILAIQAASLGGPLLEGKTTLGGRLTVYVCQNYTCKAPVTDVAALEKQLND